MAAGNWVDWNTGDLVTAAAFQDIQDSIVFIYADETAADAALTNKVEGTIFYDTTADVLKAWDGSAWISAETGDISAVTAGDGLSGGGSSGDVTLDLDLNELTAASVDVANDSIPIVDATDNSSKKESIADLATAMADGSTITASSGVLSAAGITEADQWTLTADITASVNPISTNWARPIGLLQTYIGTGMTESSGQFTFPSTGKWLVKVAARIYIGSTGGVGVMKLSVTDDNFSTSDAIVAAYLAGNTGDQAKVYGETIIDIVDTSTHKCRFSYTVAGTSTLLGGTTENETAVMFIKLGET